MRGDGVCIGCKTRACFDDRQLCLLIQDKNRAGDAYDAFSDGAIFGAILAGMELDAYEELLYQKYAAARRALGAYKKRRALDAKRAAELDAVSEEWRARVLAQAAE